MNQKIILFGTGNLGKRYLQAILANKDSCQVICNDWSAEALNSIDLFLSQNNIVQDKVKKVYDLQQTLDFINSESLVIVATTAKGRAKLLEQIITKQPKYLLIEKPVTQTDNEYLNIIELCRLHSIEAYVHYTYRFQPFCKELKETILSTQDFQYISSLPQMGIACVGIHQIDLFLWLFDVTDFTISSTAFEGIYEQKRSSFFDLYGDISIKTNNNGFGRFINSNADSIRSAMIVLNDEVITLFEDQRIMTILKKSDNKTITTKELKYEFASHYMSRIIGNFMNGNLNSSNELVPLDFAYQSHKVIFDFMKKYNQETLNIT